MNRLDHVKIGRRLEAIRTAVGQEKGDFARGAGIDPSSYSKIIRGDKPLKIDMGYKVALRWGVPLDYIYMGRVDRLPVALSKRLMEEEGDA